ncbi:alanine/glycine:cation symporter family protein [Halodesulfovibrio marinisediminis]|uniref:Alanine or glycine:cation symporter, AGCS family n=1 Tax=Halodesulfovibrio marinisediminis DSM 17456 TaxID=1121457 RepID=A0A1N6IXH2_9BACT|nr:sodium:alanine symporter family protein [Halodesulfovibrio marinisediminis]SIO36710.1 alanine or glycine:cation symporter, AGCS family [Halodesulfovibrio marinisediminis DSM 17456]
MESFMSWLEMIDGWVWGPVMLTLLVGTGLLLTIMLKGLQFRKLGYSLYLALIKRKDDDAEEGDITNFEALMTALSATVGTGNIAGVATAIAVGGPGALFWMWITGLVGMATKFGEAVLAVKYRVKDENGEMCGGPMYYIARGLGWKGLGSAFAFFAAVAAFGIGNMVQSNSVALAVKDTFGIDPFIVGVALAVLTALVVLGGIKSIGKVTSILIPIMIVFYVGGALFILLTNVEKIGPAFGLVFEYAFNPVAATGGFAGATVAAAIRFGVARGVFSNESGLGSAPIAAAAAQTKHPVDQALVSMTQTFIDTIVICTMTGLVIIMFNWDSGLTSSSLTTEAFRLGFEGGQYIVTIGLILFAYSTILGWCYYGEKSIEYLLGAGAIKPYRLVYIAAILFGSVQKVGLVWTLADIFNGLMALPNLIGLIFLSPVIVRETREYFAMKEGIAPEALLQAEDTNK